MKSFAASLLALLFVLGALTSGFAQGNAVHVSGDGHTFLNPATGVFEGTVDLLLNGNAVSGTASAALLGMRPLPNGTIIARTSHTFDLGDGNTIVTYDHVQLVPTANPGEYVLISHIKVVGGTGAYDGATGHLQTVGTVNFATGEAIWTTRGVVVP